MKHGFAALWAAFWDPAVAPYLRVAQPGSILIVGGSDPTLAAALLDASAPWGGVIHLAERAPGFDPASLRQPDSARFTLHRAEGRDAAGLLPVPDLVVFDGPGTWRSVTGVLHALQSQGARTGKRFPVVLAAGVNGPGGRRDGDTAPDELAGPRAGILTALEDFAAAGAGGLSLSVLPLLTGLAVLAPRNSDGPVAGLLNAIAMGSAAMEAAALASASAASLEDAAEALRRKLQAAEYRNQKLHEALRLAQIEAASRADADRSALELSDKSEPDAAPGGLKGSLKSLLQSAGLRRRDAAAADPHLEADIARLRASPVVNDEWYLARYGDVAASGFDAAAHYVRFGAAEGRDPGPDFVTAFYLAAAPDVARSGINPLLHYLVSGASEGRDPSPDFSTRYYLEANPDVSAAGVNPLEHFLAQGRAEGRQGLPPL